MPADELLRVVLVRRGTVRPTEFRLRPGETGLSVFRSTPDVSPDAIVSAVRAARKQGELGTAAISASVFRALGLRIVPTPGGTPDPAVNACHVEARPSWWRRLVLRARGRAVHDWFNERVTPELARAARLSE